MGAAGKVGYPCMLPPALGFLEEEAHQAAPGSPGLVHHPTSSHSMPLKALALLPTFISLAAKGSCGFGAELAWFELQPQPHFQPLMYCGEMEKGWVGLVQGILGRAGGVSSP